MTLAQRRIFMLFFVALFFVITPTIIFFAKGYRFDFQNGIFVYSGSITIKSSPREIDIYLNGKKQKGRKLNYINGSYTINGIKPGKYLLECKKDGHSLWEKNIWVHSGVSTEFWNILLFPKKENMQINEHQKDIEQFFLSPENNDELFFFSENEQQRSVNLINIKTQKTEEIFKTDQFFFLDPKEKENIEWSSDKKSIFIPVKNKEGEKNYVIAKTKKDELYESKNLFEIFYQEEKNQEEPLSTSNDVQEKNKEYQKTLVPFPSFKKVRWMFDKNDELVILTTDHNLFYFDINHPEEKILIEKNVSGFNFAGNRIYYTQLPNNIVWEIKNGEPSTKRQITTQPFETSENSFIEINVYDEYRLTIRDEETGNFFIYNEEKEKNEIITKEIPNIKGSQFSNDGKKLLYWNEFEIWFLMLRNWDVQPVRIKGEEHLITRFSEPVKNVQWLDTFENIIFSVGNKIKTTEIDMRDQPNIIDIFESLQTFEDRDILYNKSNQMLIFKDSEQIIKSTKLIENGGFFGIGG